MGLRILMQSVTVEELRTITENIPGRPDQHVCNEGMFRMAKKVIRPDTEINLGYLDKHSGSVIYRYPAAVNDISIVNKIIEAEEKGYDAVLTNAFIDCGLQEAREAVNIPVVGPCESSMLVAQLVGRKFAVVTVRRDLISPIEELLHRYGWEDRAIRNKPVRHIEPWYWDAMIACYQGKPDKLIAYFEEIAMECINDGADSVIMGCFPASAALTSAGYRRIGATGVPFICPAATALKIAEMMADLRHSIGLTKTEASAGPYRTLPREMLAQIRKNFGF
jgi:allantoin racemase